MNKSKEKSEGLIAGAASVNITPKNSQFLFGYPFVERMSEGVNDWLLSSALYLANENGQVLLVSNDIIFVSKASVSRIRKKVSKATGVPAERIMVSATHTHSGPVTVNYMISSKDAVVPSTDTDYVSYMEDKISEAACTAFWNATPAKAGFLLANGTGVGTNRHDPSGVADLNIPAVVVKSRNEEFIACMLVCNMHPTVLHEDSKLYSGDFPAFSREVLQKKYFGSQCPVLYFTGAAGNQSPRYVTKDNTFEEARRIGGIVATAVGEKIKKELEYISDIPIFSIQKMVDLPKRRFPTAEWAEVHRKESLDHYEYLRKNSEDSKKIRSAEVDWFGAEELLHLSRLSKEGKLEDVYQSCLPAEIQIVGIGPYNFAAWPGEIFIEYALALKKELKNTYLITLTNGELQGYVATEEAEKMGFYEASNSIFHFSSGKILVDETIKLIKEQV